MEINWLLGSGADLNRQNVGGRTALMYALHLDKPAIANNLLEAKADPNVADNDG